MDKEKIKEKIIEIIMKSKDKDYLIAVYSFVSEYPDNSNSRKGNS